MATCEALERGGEAVVYPRRNTPEVKGEEGRARGRDFGIFSIVSVDSRVRVTQYEGAFEETGPNKTIAQVKWWLVVVRWWFGGGGCSVFARPVQVGQKQKQQQQQQQHHRSENIHD